MQPIPIFINCRDRLECLKQMLEWLENAPNVLPVLIDNASTYPPLLEYFRRCKCPMVRLQENVGPAAPWRCGVIETFTGEFFVVGDSDVIPREDCPVDAFGYCANALIAHPSWRCVGLGVEIHDLPDCYARREEVVHLEQSYWRQPLTRNWFAAPVDNYNCPVYRRGTEQFMCKAIAGGGVPSIAHFLIPPDRQNEFVEWARVRANGVSVRANYPYVARHYTWYLDSNNLPEDEVWYRTHGQQEWSCWSREVA